MQLATVAPVPQRVRSLANAQKMQSARLARTATAALK
jgi:hypothetical protein